MKNVATIETYEPLTREQLTAEQAQVSPQPAPPVAPLHSKYVLSVFVDLQDAIQAGQKLRIVGFEEETIRVLTSHDLLEAVAQDHSPFNLVASIDHEPYLREAYRGRFFLVVYPSRYAQLPRIARLLASHHAYLARYIDTWTVTELLP